MPSNNYNSEESWVYSSVIIIDMFHCTAQTFSTGMAKIVLLSLLWCLVEVHSQTEYPHVSFMGETLPNHSYVDLTQVGNDDSDPGNVVRCHTDLLTCCSNHGDWYSPEGDELSEDGDIYVVHSVQEISLHRSNHSYPPPPPSGIYHCDIPVNGDDDSVRESVYIGLYSSGGKELDVYKY